MSRHRAEQSAQQLLEAYGVAGPPVDVVAIAKSSGAEIEYEIFKQSTAVSGVLVRHDGNIIIGVNRAHADTRQRFTIAHELGHLRLHPGKPLIVEKQFRIDYRDEVSSMATNQQEIEANQFAAALLMPENWVRKVAREYLDTLTPISEQGLISKLADDFRVSGQSMGYRLINLGIITSIDVDVPPRWGA